MDPKKKTPIAKGHRQKGAGTVITAKPPVITSDGIILKTHEKLPSQLLNEYCQSKQRPKPKYHTQSPSHRFSVLLEDPKNNRNDLTFCPTQSFDSDHQARDYAALLALWHIQKSLPLENKLPEPYATTWRQMLENERNDKKFRGGKNSISTTQSSSSSTTTILENTSLPLSNTIASAPDASVTPSSATKANSSTTTAGSISESSDWICDSCGTLNFGTLMSGIIRTKCFKCQVNKTDKCVRIMTTTATTTPTSQPIKPIPTPVLNLKIDKNVSSRGIHEDYKRTCSAEQTASNRRKRAYFDALRRANKPTYVFLDSNLKLKLEQYLGISYIKPHIDSGTVGEGSDTHKTLTQLYTDLLTTSLLTTPSLTAQAQLQVLQTNVIPSLQKQGFANPYICYTLQHFLDHSTTDDSLLRIQTDIDILAGNLTSSLLSQTDVASIEHSLCDSLSDMLLELFMEYLCLHMDESDIPDIPIDNKPMLLQVYQPSARISKKAEVGVDSSDVVVEIEEVESRVRPMEFTRLLQLGLSVSDCEVIRAYYQNLHCLPTTDLDIHRISIQYLTLIHTVLLSLLHSYTSDMPTDHSYIAVPTPFSLFTTASLTTAPNQVVLEEEYECLAAIYGEENVIFTPITVTSTDSATLASASTHLNISLYNEFAIKLTYTDLALSLQEQLSLVYTDIDLTSSDLCVVLHVLLSQQSNYPNEVPIILLVPTPISHFSTPYNLTDEPPSIIYYPTSTTTSRHIIQLIHYHIWCKAREYSNNDNEAYIYRLIDYLKSDFEMPLESYREPSHLLLKSTPMLFNAIAKANSDDNTDTTTGTPTSAPGLDTLLTAASASIGSLISVLAEVQQADQLALSPEEEANATASLAAASALSSSGRTDLLSDSTSDLSSLTSRTRILPSSSTTTNIPPKKPVSRANKPSFWNTPASSTTATDKDRDRDSPSIRKMAQTRQALPAYQSRTEFLQLISEHRGLIVTGETGCGE